MGVHSYDVMNAFLDVLDSILQRKNTYARSYICLDESYPVSNDAEIVVVNREPNRKSTANKYKLKLRQHAHYYNRPSVKTERFPQNDSTTHSIWTDGATTGITSNFAMYDTEVQVKYNPQTVKYKEINIQYHETIRKYNIYVGYESDYVLHEEVIEVLNYLCAKELNKPLIYLGGTKSNKQGKGLLGTCNVMHSEPNLLKHEHGAMNSGTTSKADVSGSPKRTTGKVKEGQTEENTYISNKFVFGTGTLHYIEEAEFIREGALFTAYALEGLNYLRELLQVDLDLDNEEAVDLYIGDSSIPETIDKKFMYNDKDLLKYLLIVKKKSGNKLDVLPKGAISFTAQPDFVKYDGSGIYLHVGKLDNSKFAVSDSPGFYHGVCRHYHKTKSTLSGSLDCDIYTLGDAVSNKNYLANNTNNIITDQAGVIGEELRQDLNILEKGKSLYIYNKDRPGIDFLEETYELGLRSSRECELKIGKGVYRVTLTRMSEDLSAKLNWYIEESGVEGERKSLNSEETFQIRNEQDVTIDISIVMYRGRINYGGGEVEVKIKLERMV